MQRPPVEAAEWKKLAIGVGSVGHERGHRRAEVKSGGTVTVHYTGWLTNGKKFDSSVDRGQPISFPLNRVIKGWQDGIPGMKPGGVRRLKIPANLGYEDARRLARHPAKRHAHLRSGTDFRQVELSGGRTLGGLTPRRSPYPPIPAPRGDSLGSGLWGFFTIGSSLRFDLLPEQLTAGGVDFAARKSNT